MNGQKDGAKERADQPTPFPNIEDEPPEKERDLKGKKRSETPTHRRTISGSIFSKLLRTSSDQEKQDGDEQSRGAMAELQKRKRKGSLRKAVLGKGRERKGSDKQKSSPLSASKQQDEETTPRPSRDMLSVQSPESPPRWPFRTLSRVSIPSIRSSIASIDPASSRASIMSPTMPIDASSDDDVMLPKMPVLMRLPSSGHDSYFPPIQEPVRRMLTARQKSPLATQPQSVAGTPDEEEEWDYSETAFWGYVILFVTWLVFVVGMGSCFGVWSWAWDVGETAPAPPELEDDASLPIVGYYPALLVLTCIMAWVWVVIAWVGMKYFRHADFKGDDG